MTKAGIPGPLVRVPVVDKRTGRWTTKQVRAGHARFMGVLGDSTGRKVRATVVWCPFCDDYEGAEVTIAPKATYGERLDAAIEGHLEECETFALWEPPGQLAEAA